MSARCRRRLVLSGTLLSVGVLSFAAGVLARDYRQDWKDADFKLKGWQLTGGLEQRWFSIGKSTVFAEYGNIELATGGGDLDVDYWGLGFVQAIDAAAMDMYLGYRNYDLGGETASSASAGARIKF